MTKSQYLGTFEQVVLLALASVAGDADGMSIYDEIRRATGREVSAPAVYVTLKRLEAKKMVSSEIRLEEAGAGPPTRKYFRLESAGVDALKRAKTLLDSLWERVGATGLGESS